MCREAVNQSIFILAFVGVSSLLTSSAIECRRQGNFQWNIYRIVSVSHVRLQTSIQPQCGARNNRRHLPSSSQRRYISTEVGMQCMHVCVVWHHIERTMTSVLLCPRVARETLHFSPWHFVIFSGPHYLRTAPACTFHSSY